MNSRRERGSTLSSTIIDGVRGRSIGSGGTPADHHPIDAPLSGSDW
jgi:hypothetical protein